MTSFSVLQVNTWVCLGIWPVSSWRCRLQCRAPVFQPGSSCTSPLPLSQQLPSECWPLWRIWQSPWRPPSQHWAGFWRGMCLLVQYLKLLTPLFLHFFGTSEEIEMWSVFFVNLCALWWLCIIFVTILRFLLFQYYSCSVVYSELWHCGLVPEEHLVCKNCALRCWHSYLSGAQCKWSAFGPADSLPPTISFFTKTPNDYLSDTCIPGYRGRESI